MIFNAILSNPWHPEYGQASIPFPIPDEEYQRTLELLKPLGIGDALEKDCQLDSLDSAFLVLRQMEEKSANLDELDYLAKRMESFCAGEAAQFQAMAHKLGISDIKDFINLTFCCQQATVIADFSNLEEVGKRHYMNLNGGGASGEELVALDGYETALQLIGSGAGTVTPYGVVYDNGMKLEPLYNGRQFPAYLYDHSIIMLEVAPGQGLGEGQNPEYLGLPAPESQLERAMLRAGVSSYADMQPQLVFDELPDLTADALDLEHLSGDDVPALNRLCQAFMPMIEENMEKLNAVVLATEASGILPVCCLAENLDQFDFVPGIRTPEEYGRYLIQRSGAFGYDKHLEDFYDYRRYGEQRIEQEGGQINSCGYVAYHGTMALEELMREDPLYQAEQKVSGPIQEMGQICPGFC